MNEIVEQDKKLWIIDLVKRGLIRQVPMDELFYCGATDSLVYEEDDELRPVWVVMEGDHEEAYADL